MTISGIVGADRAMRTARSATSARRTEYMLTLRGRLKCSAQAEQISATIWASSRTGDPYFVILGASLLPLA